MYFHLLTVSTLYFFRVAYLLGPLARESDPPKKLGGIYMILMILTALTCLTNSSWSVGPSDFEFILVTSTYSASSWLWTVPTAFLAVKKRGLTLNHISAKW